MFCFITGVGLLSVWLTVMTRYAGPSLPGWTDFVTPVGAALTAGFATANVDGIELRGWPWPWQVRRYPWDQIEQIAVGMTDLLVVPADGGRPFPIPGSKEPFLLPSRRRTPSSSRPAITSRPSGSAVGSTKSRTSGQPGSSSPSQ